MRRTKWMVILVPLAMLSVSACGDDGGGGDGTPTADCATDADCNDGDACNGLETCVEGACLDGTPANEGSECQVEDQLGFCTTGSCSVSTCGDEIVDAAADEDCDDGNEDDTDGCTGDCTFTCVEDSDCHDGQVCNGPEVCDTAGHTCGSGTQAANGTVCTVEGETSAHFCTDGLCLPNTCGDGFVGDTEACDDGNDVPGDGCEPDCTWTCSSAPHCDDGNPCNGQESCVDHVCSAGTPLGEGAACGTAKECIAGACTTADCGDGTLNSGEVCDDGNDVPGDGCEADCTWTCETEADCSDDTVCTGTEGCVDHVCTPGVPLDCDDQDPCTADACDAAFGCLHVLIDADGDGVYCGDDCDDNAKGVGVAPTWYKDCDDDGYAAVGATTQVSCTEPAGGSTCLGWTSRDPAASADCADEVAEAHPGAGWHDAPWEEVYYCQPGPFCTRSSWDWDCDGNEDERWTETGTGTSAPCDWMNLPLGGRICVGVSGWTDAFVPLCGDSGTLTRCVTDLAGSTCTRATGTDSQECR